MKRKNKGFTLIELLAVIVILAIIMIIATMQVNKQIKKAKKDSNYINKKTIARATKTCMVQQNIEECDSISELQEGGYLDNFEDPWTKSEDNLDDSYVIVIDEDKTEVIYAGPGVKDEYEIPPEEYFSWCNNDAGKQTCTDGLTNEGKAWLQKHDDILIFPDSVKTIKNCESNTKNCTNFSGVKIDALIATSSVSINADFSGTKIGVVKIDGGSIGTSKFQNATIKKLILGNATSFIVNNYAFNGSVIDYFEIKSGVLGWQSGPRYIKKLVIGKNVADMGGNTFSGVSMNELIIGAEDSFASWNGNHAFRGGNNCSNETATPKVNKVIIKDSVKKLPKNMIANNVSVRYIAVGELYIEGDKNRFTAKELYEVGFNCDKIVSALKDSNNEVDVQTCRNITNNGKPSTENCKLQ